MVEKRSFRGIPHDEMKEFLEEKYLQYNNPQFIPGDPVSIPHRFTSKQDIEISGFLTATIAWGRRDLILSAADKLMDMMGNEPYEFIRSGDDSTLERFGSFYYRTFNGIDCIYFIRALREIYRNYESMEDIIADGLYNGLSLREAVGSLRERFFSIPGSRRTGKHFANVTGNAAGKRINMFMRWMVRSDGRGVDFGIWKRISPSSLMIPLDLHTGNTSRRLGLLERRANDWKAVEELTASLRSFDPYDPVKYDFALFGLGVNEKF